MFFLQCTTSEYAQETDCMKLLEPQMNDGLASGVAKGTKASYSLAVDVLLFDGPCAGAACGPGL